MHPSGRKSLISLLLLLFVCLAPADVKWQKTYAAAAKLAKQTGKPILIDFSAEWCGPCKMLESDVFPKAKVQSLLARVIPLRLDVDTNPPEATKYQVSSIPRLILISPNAGQILWDATGFRDADSFATELAEALGVKNGGPAKSFVANPAAEQVRSALEKGSFRSLDPAVAAKGLAILVEDLGVYQESDFKPAAALIQKAGPAAVPALVRGMGHKTLAVRVGAYRVIQTLAPKGKLAGLKFNPWASSKDRAAQLAAWKARFMT